MAEQVERLQKLAVDLLDLSRLDAGSVELAREPVDLSELARAVAGEFKPAVARHATELELHLPARIRADCDRERVAQIMRILLDNALRHTPEGTPVTVTAGRENGAARVTVADEGPGLPDDRQVFDRFSTGDAARGAGLGLAIARELAERMDGSLRADSRPVGSAFTLELPAAAEVTRLAAALLAALALASCNGDDGSGEPAADSEATKGGADHTRRGRGGARPRRVGSTPTQLYDRLSPGVVTVISLFNDGAAALLRGEDDGEGGQGSGFVLDGDGLHRHQRARRDRRASRRTPSARRRSTSSCRAATACEPRSSATTPTPTWRCSRSIRRGSSSRRCGSAASRDLTVGAPVAAIGSPFGERQSLSVGVISALDRTIESLTAVPDRQRDPDRRRHQPRQLGRPAAERAGQGARHQLPDQVHQRRRRGRGLRDTRGRRAPFAARAARDGRWTTATWA